MNQNLWNRFEKKENYKYWIFYGTMKEYEPNEVEHMKHKFSSSKNERKSSWKNEFSTFLEEQMQWQKDIHSILMSTKESTFHNNVC